MAVLPTFRHLLQRGSLKTSHSNLRAAASYNVVTITKRVFSTEDPPRPPVVAPVNSVADAEQFADSHDTLRTEPDDDEGADNASLTTGPRVARLPEDLSAEQLAKLTAESQGDKGAKPAKKEEDEDEEKEPAYPKFAKAAQAKKRNPVLLADAIREVKANARAKFDETLEAHVRLGVDPRRSDQTVRGAATLPHGSGKVVRVAVFAEGPAAEEAERAGADVIGADELVTAVQESGGKLNFDKCIATPAFMPRLGKVARILGPRGLMPNPKVGSVTNNVGEAVRAAKQGRVDFRADKAGIVHAGLGKVSFKEDALLENVAAFTGALLAAKPTGLKKASRYAGYINNFVITSTMGAGVHVSLQSLVQAADNFSKSAEAR